MGIIGEIKKELLERIIGKFKSVIYSNLNTFYGLSHNPNIKELILSFLSR